MQIFAACEGCATVLVPVDPGTAVHEVKGRILSLAGCRLEACDTWLSCQGRPCQDMAPVEQTPIEEGGTVTLHARLRGGGGDGGSTGAESRVSYLEMYASKRPDKVNPAEAKLALWTQCRLTGERLQPPCCADELGSLFNKDAVVTALVTKAMPKSLSHITSLRHLVDLRLTPTQRSAQPAAAVAAGAQGTQPRNEAEFCCPVTGTEMNGRSPFVVLQPSGLVVSERALKQAPATVEELSGSKGALLDAIPLNPPIEDALIMRQQLMTKRAAAKAKKASKQASKALAAAVPEAVASAMAAVEHGSGAAAARTAVPEPAHAQKRSAAAMAEPQLHADQVKTKKFRATDLLPAQASEKVWSSIFTGGRVAQETYSCRSNSARGMKL